jgi:hypothetical protein
VCAQYRLPNGVAFTFQVCLYSIEPLEANCLVNLFAKNRVRSSLPDEIEEGGPEVSLVGLSELPSCAGERLAW